MISRPYIVTDVETGARRLIRAATPAQAVRHAVRTRFSVAVASADAVVDLMLAGVKPETAGGEQPELAIEEPAS